MLDYDIQLYTFIIYTFFVAFYGHKVIIFITKPIKTYYEIKENMFQYVKNIRFIKNKINKEVNETINSLQNEFFPKIDEENIYRNLPVEKIEGEKIKKQLEFYKEMGKVDYEGGKVSGTIYTNDKNNDELILETYKMFQWTNPLHTDSFPGIQKMEASIVSMCLNLYKADSTSIGNMTSGGTESILMACKAYRDRALNEYKITEPEIIVPESAHVAFDKACEYLKIKLIKTRINSENQKADINLIKCAITKNTILIVGSAPSFPHGVIDDICELSEITLNNPKIGLHVDACLGGFLIPFMKHIYPNQIEYNFGIKGVTSISIDTHKYGRAPKGTSVIMYRSKELAHYQYCIQPDWMGGIYISPTVSGSRSGAIIAATWAIMMNTGYNKYKKITKDIHNLTLYISKKISEIDGIQLIVEPELCIISFTSNIFNIYQISEKMSEKGWSLNTLQNPNAVHLCITSIHTKEIGTKFILDLEECCEYYKKNPNEKSDGMAAIYGKAQKVPDMSIIKEIGYGYLDAYYTL